MPLANGRPPMAELTILNRRHSATEDEERGVVTPSHLYATPRAIQPVGTEVTARRVGSSSTLLSSESPQPCPLLPLGRPLSSATPPVRAPQQAVRDGQDKSHFVPCQLLRTLSGSGLCSGEKPISPSSSGGDMKGGALPSHSGEAGGMVRQNSGGTLLDMAMTSAGHCISFLQLPFAVSSAWSCEPAQCWRSCHIDLYCVYAMSAAQWGFLQYFVSHILWVDPWCGPTGDALHNTLEKVRELNRHGIMEKLTQLDERYLQKMFVVDPADVEATQQQQVITSETWALLFVDTTSLWGPEGYLKSLQNLLCCMPELDTFHSSIAL